MNFFHDSLIQTMTRNLNEEEDFAPREVRNPAARAGNVVHWVTHARKRGLGMWAWILNRVTAVTIIFSTILHVLRNQFGVLTLGGAGSCTWTSSSSQAPTTPSTV